MHFVGAVRENNKIKNGNTQKKNNENADDIYSPFAESEKKEEQLELELFLTYRQSLDHQQVQLVSTTSSSLSSTFVRGSRKLS